MQENQSTIREFENTDLDCCTRVLIQAYNGEPWRNHWTDETATRYLREFAESKSFVGFVICVGKEVVGAAFTHVKTWWTSDELFVDEIFIKPEMQRKGHGRALLGAVEEYAKSRGLAGVTLLTNKYMPAKRFYERDGYVLAEHVVFMYKLANGQQ